MRIAARRRLPGWALGAFLLGITALAGRVHAEPIVLARVGDTVLTADDLLQQAAAQSIFHSTPVADSARLTELLERMIADVLTALESETVSLGDYPDARARIRQSVTSVARQLYATEHVDPLLQVDSATIDTFYRAHIDRYTTSAAQWHVRHLQAFRAGLGPPSNATTWVDSLYQGWDPRRKIDSLYVRLTEGEDFAALAAAHSEDIHTRGTGGDMGWVSEDHLPKEILGERIRTQPLYLISRPFESRYGWHIVQVLGRRPAGPIPIDDKIRADIVRILVQQQSTAILARVSDSLMAASTLTVFDAALAVPDREWSPRMPLAVANGRDTLWASEYVTERLGWESQNQGRALSAEQKTQIIGGEYYRRLCWYKAMRDLGYLKRPEVVAVAGQMARTERTNIYHLRVAVPGYDPDSAAIRTYYHTHPAEFAKPPQTLTQAWQGIRTRLKTEHRARAEKQNMERLVARYGVQRYPDRLGAVRLPDR